MTPHQFWNEDPDLLWAYLDAYKLKTKEMAQHNNTQCFNQGFYFLLALRDIETNKYGHKKDIYPKKPIPLAGERKPLPQKDIDLIRKQRFLDMQEAIMSKYKK